MSLDANVRDTVIRWEFNGLAVMRVDLRPKHPLFYYFICNQMVDRCRITSEAEQRPTLHYVMINVSDDME